MLIINNPPKCPRCRGKDFRRTFVLKTADCFKCGFSLALDDSGDIDQWEYHKAHMKLDETPGEEEGDESKNSCY